MEVSCQVLSEMQHIKDRNKEQYAQEGNCIKEVRIKGKLSGGIAARLAWQ